MNRKIDFSFCLSEHYFVCTHYKQIYRLVCRHFRLKWHAHQWEAQTHSDGQMERERENECVPGRLLSFGSDCDVQIRHLFLFSFFLCFCIYHGASDFRKQTNQRKRPEDEFSIDLKNVCTFFRFVSFHKNNKKEYKQLHVPRKWYIKIFESASFTESEWKWPLNVTMNRITYGRYTWAHTMHLRLNERKNEVEGRKRDA